MNRDLKPQILFPPLNAPLCCYVSQKGDSPFLLDLLFFIQNVNVQYVGLLMQHTFKFSLNK